MSGYTPGPWLWNSYDAIGHRAFIDGEWDMEFVAHVEHLNDTDHGDDIHGPRREEAHANARLIAAAPDLLDALLLTLAAIHDPTGEKFAIAIKAALDAKDKAEGVTEY